MAMFGTSTLFSPSDINHPLYNHSTSDDRIGERRITRCIMFLTAPATANQINISLLILRLITGLTLAAHGWQKVFSYGMSTIAGNFSQMGIPLASVTGPFISLLELIGGITMAAGLLTRPVAALLAIDMLVASLLVHRPNGFFAPTGMELTLLLASACAALAIAGAGAFSADAAIARQDHSQLNSLGTPRHSH
jgi:putative oxidoreductase